MNVLGIETSCDETAASVVRDGRTVLSNVVSSKLDLHRRYGGIVPEIASRLQVESISYVVSQALKESGTGLTDLGLVSVTFGPGLAGSLLIGISFAKALALSKGLPLVGVNHILSHIYAAYMYNERLKFPFIGFVVSGGHTSLFYFKNINDQKLLGKTRDDAAGEAFDKVAKLLGLGYPGGSEIERLSEKGNPQAVDFPRAYLGDSLDFSFSGIKTSVMYYLKTQNSKLRTQNLYDICASFQEAVLDVLVDKAILACQRKRVKQLALGGGVVCNLRFRERLTKDAKNKGIEVFFPPKELCLDNAAMVAGLGYELFRQGKRADLELTAVPS